MKHLIRTKSFAITAMCVLIVAGIVLGGGISLKEHSRTVSASFSDIQNNLNRRVNAAQNMIVIGKQFNKLQENQVNLETTTTAMDSLRKAETLSQKYQADQQLDAAVVDLYMSLRGTTIQDTNNQSINDLFHAFNDANDVELITAYNQKGTEFNDQLNRFPINIFRSLYHGEPVELFR